MISYAILKAEILADPLGIGHLGDTDQPVADLLNSVSTGRTMPRTTISAADFMAALKLTELLTLSVNSLEALRLYVAAAVIDLSDPDVQTALGILFPQATCPNSFAQIQALERRPCSRAEELLGTGVVVSASDVAQARTS